MIADIEEDLLSRTLKEQVKNNQNALSTARAFLDQAEAPPTERTGRTLPEVSRKPAGSSKVAPPGRSKQRK